MHQIKEKLCPSAPCNTGALLIGRLGKDGKVIYLDSPFVITDSFVNQANVGRVPEERFRFSSACAKSKCKNWNNRRCQLVFDLIEIINLDEIKVESVSPCSIQYQCRWYSQAGKLACSTCSYISTQRKVR